MRTGLAILYLTGFLTIVFFFTMYRPDIPVDELKKKYAGPSSAFLPLDGMLVHYRIEGKGFPLVLIHGTSSSLHAWDAWSHILQNHFTVIRLDMPAFGLTGPNARHEYSINYYVTFLDSFLTKLGIDSFFLAGVSLGGHIAWQFAATHPQQVKKLILVAASGYPREELPRLFRIARLPLLPHILRHFTPRYLVAKTLKEVYYNDSLVTDQHIDRHYELMLREGNRQAFLARMRYLHLDDHQKIKQISCPTFIMWGKHDTWIPLHHAYRFKQDISYSILKIYDKAGHVPNEEIPEQTAQDVLTFLTAL